MKRLPFLLIILITALSSISVSAQDSIKQHKGQIVDGIVAVVGKNIVKLSDIENSYAQIRIRQGLDNAQIERCQLLESMLITKLLVHKGTIDSTEVSDEEVEEQVQFYLKNYVRQYGSKEAMRQATGYTFDEMHDIYFDLLHDKILSQRVEYSLTQNVKITPAEVVDYYNKIDPDSIPTIEEEYELAEITIQPSISENERERVRAELAALRERILKGEKFNMLATLYSQDPGSAKKGGELGFFTRGDMVGEFEAAAFALKPGEVSPIIETMYGFHIIQLIERRGNSINVRHILLIPKTSSEDMLQARIKLDSIATEIRLGHLSFQDAAQKYSDGASKDQGGIVTNSRTASARFSKSQVAETFPGISVASMKEGDVSNAIAMKNSDNKDIYRILQLTKKVNEHKANLNDDYDRIYNAALQEAKNKKVIDWCNRMVKNTYIHISDDFINCPNFQINWVR